MPLGLESAYFKLGSTKGVDELAAADDTVWDGAFDSGVDGEEEELKEARV